MNDIPIAENSLWIWSRSTLHRFIKSIGFAYEDKTSHYQHTRDRVHVLKIRDGYLEWLYYYREQRYRIFYQNKTWLFKNMTCSKIWQYDIVHATDGTFMVPTGKRERSVLFHIGSPDTGLLDNCILLFRGSKSNMQADYHSETNWNVFINWCETVVFPKSTASKKNSIDILDRATQNTILNEEDKRPSSSYTDGEVHQITGH